MTLIFAYQGKDFAVVSTDLLHRRVPASAYREKGRAKVIQEWDFETYFGEKFRRSKVGNHWIVMAGWADGYLTKRVYSTPLEEIEKGVASAFHLEEAQSDLAFLIYKPGKGLRFCGGKNAKHHNLSALPTYSTLIIGNTEEYSAIKNQLRSKNKSPEEVALEVHRAVKMMVDMQIPLNEGHALRGVSTYLANHTVKRIANSRT